MKNARMAIYLVVVFVALTSAAQAFTLTGNDYLQVTDKYGEGILYDSSMADVYNWIYRASVYDEATLRVLAGGASSVTAYDNSNVKVSDGTISVHLSTHGNCNVDISGGYNPSTAIYDNSTMNISGGRVGSFYVWDNSTVNISDGTLDNFLYAFDSSTVTMSGGTIGDNIRLGNQAILEISGSNFTIDGISFGFGEITSILGNDAGDESYRTLTGTFANGDIINNQFQIGNTAKIILVPEPATLGLLAIGGLYLRKRR